MIDLAQKLFALSEKMLASAEAEQWSDIEDIQEERTRILKEMEASPAPSTQHESDQLTSILQSCQQIEVSCTEILKRNRTKIQQEYNKLSKGQAMRKAYGSHRQT